MKRLLYFLLSLAAIFLVVCVIAKPLTLFLVKKQIQKNLPGSEVSIQNLQFKSFREVSFSNIEIKNQLPHRWFFSYTNG